MHGSRVNNCCWCCADGSAVLPIEACSSASCTTIAEVVNTVNKLLLLHSVEC